VVLRLVTVPELSALPGLVHGFERRHGPEVREPRDETLSRVRKALGETGRLLLMRQVHGAIVLRAPWEGTPEADAAVAGEPGLVLGIATADCHPVLLVDPVRRAVAAAHAGWRGTAAGVAARTVEALVAAGSRPDDLAAAIGPGIGSCCYEVGEDLRDAFVGGDAFFRPGPRGRPHLDVRAANVTQLRDAGVRADRIHHVDECTSCRPALYYSYRRDGQGTGRMINFIGFRAFSSPT
jgi:YfiH family protein